MYPDAFQPSGFAFQFQTSATPNTGQARPILLTDAYGAGTTQPLTNLLIAIRGLPGSGINGGGAQAPTQSALSTNTAGGAIANGTYYVKVTAVSASGETLPSNEQTITTTGAGTSTITITWSTVPGATSYKVYFGTSSNGENTFISEAASPVTLTALPTLTGSPPTVATWATGPVYFSFGTNAAPSITIPTAGTITVGTPQRIQYFQVDGSLYYAFAPKFFDGLLGPGGNLPGIFMYDISPIASLTYNMAFGSFRN